MPRIKSTSFVAGAAVATLDDYVSALAWSSCGEHLGAASLAGDSLIISGDARQRPPLHAGGGLALAWSPTAPILALGGQDGIVRARNDCRTLLPLQFSDWVNALAWAPTGRYLAIASGRDLILADDNMDVICTSQNTSTVTSLAWSPDSRRVGAGCYGGIAWHEPPTAQPVKRFDWKGSILTLAISPNGKWVASGNQDSSVHVWRLWSGKDLQMSGYDAKIEHIAWDPTSRWLCVGGVGEVTVWDFNGKGPQGSRPISLEGHNRHITGVAFNGNRLATSAADGTLFIWQLPADEPLATCELGQEISRVAWHPSGQRLAIGTATGDIFIVNHPTA